MRSLRRLMTTTAPASVTLIRIAVGVVFLAEGIQKFLFPNELAAGRFIKIGIPAPEVMGPFVGTVETVCGSLIILGPLTRLAAIPLIINMCGAHLNQTSDSLGHGFWRFSLPNCLHTVSEAWRMKHAPTSRCCSDRSSC